MIRPYIYTVRDGICIFDLEKTQSHLEEALAYLKSEAAAGKTVLLVGTKKQAAPLVTSLAKSLGLPYITNRWLGGMLTNFKTVRKSLDHLAELEQMMEKSEFAALKKKEQKRVTDEIAKLHRSFDGIKDLTKLPDVLFIVDANQEKNAIEEASRLGVTVIATIDTDGDPTKVDMVIPCNDDAPRGLKYVLQRVFEAISEGQGKKPELPADLAVDTSTPITITKQAATAQA
jgi:small subunit ribosomal protein S2